MQTTNRKAVISALTAVLLIANGCATTKTQVIQFEPSGTEQADMKTIKCAAQQSGWTITYVDEESLSGTKTTGMDDVPISLNIRLQAREGSNREAVITIGSPRGIVGDGSVYSAPIVKAFSSCGANAMLKPVLRTAPAH